MRVELQVFHHLNLFKFRKVSQLMMVESGPQAWDSQEPNQQDQHSQGRDSNSTADGRGHITAGDPEKGCWGF